MVIFHSFLYVYQRIYPIKSHLKTNMFRFSYGVPSFLWVFLWCSHFPMGFLSFLMVPRGEKDATKKKTKNIQPSRHGMPIFMWLSGRVISLGIYTSGWVMDITIMNTDQSNGWCGLVIRYHQLIILMNTHRSGYLFFFKLQLTCLIYEYLSNFGGICIYIYMILVIRGMAIKYIFCHRQSVDEQRETKNMIRTNK